MTQEEREEKQTRLREAKAALHQLMVGEKARVFVDQNGERVEYAVPSADRLRAYIFELEASLGVRSAHAPLHFGF